MALTFEQYTKFVSDINDALAKNYDMSELAQILFVNHGIEAPLQIGRKFSELSPMLDMFLTKDGHIVCKSGLTTQEKFDKSVDSSYHAKYFEYFEKEIMAPFYADGTIQPIEQSHVLYDFVSAVSWRGKDIAKMTLGGDKQYLSYLPDYYVPLKKARVLTVTKIKGTHYYKINFRLVNKTFETKYFTTANANSALTLAKSIKERVANGEKHSVAFRNELLIYINTLIMTKEYIVPALKETIDIIAINKNDKLADKLINSLTAYVSSPDTIVGPIMRPTIQSQTTIYWQAQTTPDKDGKPYVAYNRFTGEMTVHNVDKSNTKVDYSFESVHTYANNFHKSK